MKYSWKGHKESYRHKNRIKRSGQARLDYVKGIPTTWRGARGDNFWSICKSVRGENQLLSVLLQSKQKEEEEKGRKKKSPCRQDDANGNGSFCRKRSKTHPLYNIRSVSREVSVALLRGYKKSINWGERWLITERRKQWKTNTKAPQHGRI